jgi:hypothetical protein
VLTTDVYSGFTPSVSGSTTTALYHRTFFIKTGKSAGQYIDDARLTASVQVKLTADKRSNFFREHEEADE